VNWIDTAAVYGLGHSEEVVARAVLDIPRADRPLVFTKCSLVWDEKGNIRHALDPDSLRRELENSLRRLQTNTIDLYQIHWATWSGSSSRPDVENAWRTLVEEKKKGKIRHIGVSNFKAEEMAWIGAIEPVSSLQPPYSMLKREVEAEILPYCADHKIGVIVYSPMQAGLLTGKMTRERIAAFPEDDWRRMSSEFKEPNLTRNLALVEKLRAIGARHGKSPAEVAIAWTLRLSAVTAAIVGLRRPEQVDGVIGAAGFRLSPEDLEEIERALQA
jgi:aryl-alcohol dehydrogenase-like predicted oxidoreductase